MNILSSRTLCVCVYALPLLISARPGFAEPEDVNMTLEEYDKRIRLLEEGENHADNSGHQEKALNPVISVVLDGVYADYKNKPEDYRMQGFALGREAGLTSEGFSLGHSEIIFRSAIDDKFYGQFSISIAEHHENIEVELEEAFFETLSPLGGFKLRGGRFYSAIGNLNQQHRHVWDFYDAPLVYRGLFGDQYFDDGLRLAYQAPADMLVEIGTEALSGRKYPAGGEHDGVGSWTVFANIGGNIGVSHGWQAGLSYLSANNIEREHVSHAHTSATVEIPLFEGDSDITGANAIYTWTPESDAHERNVKIQFEFFQRNESGTITLLGSSPLETSSLDSKQRGWYLQGVWQFAHSWRAGVRYDLLDSDNTGSDRGVLDEAGLVSDGHQPERTSIMLEWIPSEFSRIRLQYNRDDSYQLPDNQVYIQYTFIMGSHGAHPH